MGYIRIKSIIHTGGNPKSFQGSLAKNGMSRLPGCGTTISPYREADGRYRTGLDENATYINNMPLDEQPIERERVKKLRERLEKETGIDLGPNSPYYTRIYNNENGSIATTTPYKISDREIALDESIPQERIAAAWLEVHPIVAPSLEATKGNSVAIAYVSNPTAELEAEYSEQIKFDTAIKTLSDMTPDKVKRMARLMDLPVNEDTAHTEAYMLIKRVFDKGRIEFGVYKGRKGVEVFNSLATLSESTLGIKDLIKKALSLSIYRKNKAGVIMQGENIVAESEDDLIATLAGSVEERTSLEKRVKSKLKLTAA